MQGPLKKHTKNNKKKPLTYPCAGFVPMFSVGGPGAKTVRMHARAGIGHKALLFFLHPGSHRRADMQYCHLVFPGNTAIDVRFRCARAGMIVGLSVCIPGM